MIDELRRGEDGFSLVEVTVAATITGIVVAAFLAMFLPFSRSVERERTRAEALASARAVMAELALELREAVPSDGVVVLRLDASWDRLELVFRSDRRSDTPGPEQYRYFLANCRGGRCDLMRSVTPADPGSGPGWTFTRGTTVVHSVLSGVRTDGTDPLFAGVSWRGGASRVVTRCGVPAPCDFSLLRVRLRVDPDPVRGGVATVEIAGDVRFRNAP